LGRGVVYYVVIGDKMVSFDGDVNMGSRPRGWMEVSTELPMDCVRVYRPKHISNTFNGSYGDERLYDCIYSKDQPSLVTTSPNQMDAAFDNRPYN
jgi:hypothetical protein